MIKYIVFLVSVLIFISCGIKEKEIPVDIIPEDKMTEMLTEIELSQALIKLKFSNQDTINQQQLFDQVFNDFNVSEEQFNKSLEFYSEQPKILLEMYTEVISNLSKKQAEYQ